LTVFCSAAQRKTLGFANKSNSNWLYFGLPRSQKFRNLTTRLHFVLQRSENFGICEQKQLKLTYFVLPHSEIFWNWLSNGLYFVLRARIF
jgi:hypothetical protein